MSDCMLIVAEFLEFVGNMKVWLQERMNHKAEVSRLQTEIIWSQSQVSKLEKKLEHAQHLLGIEQEKRIRAENQVHTLESWRVNF